jgi:hypothetical protein
MTRRRRPGRPGGAPGREAAAPPAALVAAVQHNCDIADAAHAADLSLCNFLLQMREYYRWRQGLGFGAPLARDAVGRWLAETEARWSALEDEPFVPLPIDGRAFDPFDLEAVNARLIPQGWVYGAGLAGPGRAGFFLAALQRTETVAASDGETTPGAWPTDAPDAPDSEHTSDTPGTPDRTGAVSSLCVQHAGAEHARGLFAPPAALQGTTVVLRHASIARWLWERYEAFALRRGAGPFAAVAEAFGLHDTTAFVDALPRLAALQARGLLLHELGEHRAARTLEPGWSALRLAVHDRRAALWLRAVRDLLADLRVTLPTLLDEGPPEALHLWFSHHEGPHAALCPGLDDAYRAWCAGDGGAALRAACDAGVAHFEQLARQLLALDDARAVAEALAAPTAVWRAPG